MKKVLTIIAVAFLAIGLTMGCSKKKTEDEGKKTTPPKTAQNKPKQTPSVQPPPGKVEVGAEAEGEKEKKKPEKYSYKKIRGDGKLKRNPFMPIPIDPMTQIRQYEISQMGVNGVIVHSVRKASVMTPNCMATVVEIGDKIGIHEGYVVDINLDGVLVRETYLDIKGMIQEYERLIPNKPYKCGR